MRIVLTLNRPRPGKKPVMVLLEIRLGYAFRRRRHGFDGPKSMTSCTSPFFAYGGVFCRFREPNRRLFRWHSATILEALKGIFISLMDSDVVSSRRLSMLGKEILENQHLHPRLGHAHADFRDVGIPSTIERCNGFPLPGRLIRHLQHVPDGFIQPALVVEPGRGVRTEISPIRKLSLFQMLTFEEVVKSLHGRIGKTKLRERLKSLPLFKGRPTYRRIGKKFFSVLKTSTCYSKAFKIAPHH